MKYISVKEQLFRERQRNAENAAEAAKNAADIDYIAMMCDVELDTADTTETNEPSEEV